MYVFILCQSLPDQDEKTMTCRSRGMEESMEYGEIMKPRISNHKEIYFISFNFFYLSAPLHPIPSPWKFQHPFHGRLTSNMSCKHCEQQVSFLPGHMIKNLVYAIGYLNLCFACL